MLGNINKLFATTVRRISTGNPRMGRLDGRVAIVTAGTNGIGFCIAKRLAEDGARVVVSSRKQENIDKAVKDLKSQGHEVLGVQCHIAKPDERKELLKQTESEFGGIDILVQNAGVNPHHWGIMQTPECAIDKACEVQIKANFQIVQEIQPYMAKREAQSSIVLTSSIVSYIAQIYPGIYAITKASIITMVKAFMPELLKSNIRINCVSMGSFDTDFTAPIKAVDKYKKLWLSTVPMNRVAHPSECDGMVSLLCSDDASYITGENFVVAGGQYARF